MADINLKKLSRAELLEMMISFSEEAEAARQHEKELKEELEKEKLQMQHEFADERAAMLKSFDEEKAQMRAKFNEQKAQMQDKFDKDISGLKARLAREKAELQRQVDDSLMKIENSQSLAEASIQLGGIMESAQKAADLYVNTLKKSAEAEYKELMLDIEKSKLRIKRAEDIQMQAIADKSGKTLEQVRNEAISETSDPKKDKSVEKSEPKKRTTRKKKDE